MDRIGAVPAASEEARHRKCVEDEIHLHLIKLAAAISPDLVNKLVRRIQCECDPNCDGYSGQRHGSDPEIAHSAVRHGFRVVTTQQYPQVQVTGDFSSAPIFAKLFYTHIRKLNEQKQWTRRVDLKFVRDDEPYFLLDGMRYGTTRDLACAILEPLIDVNFKPSET
jgi:hypothetical protein